VKGNLGPVGRPGWREVVGGVARELMQLTSAHWHFVDIRVAAEIGVKGEPFTIRGY
jgi:hypothetical protein